MKDYLEKLLKLEIEIIDDVECVSFPLYLQTNYRFYRMKIDTKEVCVMEALDDFSIVSIRKSYKQVLAYVQIPVVLYFKKSHYYLQTTFIQEGIPFIIENKQIYLPFLGLALKEEKSRYIQPCQRLSFLTQKLLLVSIYEGWKKVNVSQAARRIGVSKMSITRCFDEIEALHLPYIHQVSNQRVFTCLGTKKEMWQKLYPFMRNPVIKEIYLSEIPDKFALRSGVFALSEFSLIYEDYPTYAVTKRELKQYLSSVKQVASFDQEQVCTIQELGYIIPFSNHLSIDPLSIALILEDESKKEVRIEIAIEEMLEEYVWCEE